MKKFIKVSHHILTSLPSFFPLEMEGYLIGNIARRFIKSFLYYSYLALMILLWGCEKKIDIKLNEGVNKIVVEGHIEPGLPPYIILTRSQPYFSSISLKDISNLFVHNALVKVSNGKDTVILKEYASDTLPANLLKILSGQLGIDLASTQNPEGIKIYAYLTADPRMFGSLETAYALEIIVDGERLSATTYIPKRSDLDSAWTVPHPSNDTLATVFVRYSDPAGENNFIRYFTSTNRTPFYPPYFQSVLDDKSIFDVDGKTFDFPIEKGHNRNQEVDFDTFTYYTKGDSVLIRWCAIDQAHYNFWSTAEFDRGSTGNPFTSPTTIKTNITGGLGIWGGYSPSYYYLQIPE